MAERLPVMLEQGKFYEYEQLIKTLFFKLKIRKRHDEMKKIIKRAMDELHQYN